MSKPTKVTVVPIDPGGKYVLLIDLGPIDDEQRETAGEGLRKLKDALGRWWESDLPLFIISTLGGTVALQRVDEDGKGS